MGDTQVQAEEAQAAIPGNSPATAHPHNPNTADTTPHPPPEAGADTSNLPLSRIGSKPRRLNKEGKDSSVDCLGRNQAQDTEEAEAMVSSSSLFMLKRRPSQVGWEWVGCWLRVRDVFVAQGI
ncbi:hypothetical protein PTI98_004455 [Pleurotus ostreatus]|nr:hypothetical protein PTI98_004455 [Pleurotus ostreatus]